MSNIHIIIEGGANVTIYIDSGEIGQTLADIKNKLNQLLSAEGSMAQTLDDLNNAVAKIQDANQANQTADQAIQDSVNQAITLINNLRTNTGSVTDAQVEAAVSALQAAASDNNKATSDYNQAATNLANASAPGP